MLVRDVMTQDVAAVAPDDRVDDALQLLVRRRVTSLPVVDGDRVVGIVGEADLLRHLLSRDPRAHQIPVQPAPDDPPRHVRDLMTRWPRVARPDEDVSDLAVAMAEHGWKSVPVVAGRRLVGVVSRSDVVRALARPDDWIGLQVRSVLAELGHAGWQVGICDGVATLSGPGTPGERKAVAAAALAVPGVRRVHTPASSPPGEPRP